MSEPGLKRNITKNFRTRLGISMVRQSIQFYMRNCMGHKLWSTHQIRKKIFFTATTTLFSMLQKYYLEKTRILFSSGFSKWSVFAITVLPQRNVSLMSLSPQKSARQPCCCDIQKYTV